MAIETRGSQEVVGMIHEERVEDGCVEFDMTKVARTFSAEEVTGSTDVFPFDRPESRIVEAANGGSIILIEKGLVGDLEDGDRANVGGRKRRE